MVCTEFSVCSHVRRVRYFARMGVGSLSASQGDGSPPICEEVRDTQSLIEMTNGREGRRQSLRACSRDGNVG